MTLLLTVFGLGHMKIASGTWGSLPPIVLAGFLYYFHFTPADGPDQAWVYRGAMLGVLVVFSLVCIAGGKRAEQQWGKDPGQVVADEAAGQALTLLALPSLCFATPQRAAIWLSFAFLSFRLMDILKPWPAHSLEKLKGGWGILMDDLAAACYAGALTFALAKVLARV